MSGTNFKQRDIVSVPFVYSDLSGQKYRPALILSNKDYHDSNGDIVCCAMTSNLQQSCRGVLIKNENLEFGSLPQDSVLIPPKIVNIKKQMIRKKYATLQRDKSKEVLDFLNLKISLD